MNFTSTTYYEKLIDIKDILPYQLEIWNWLLGFRVGLDEKFCNPWRKDNTAGAWLEDRGRMILLVDYADFYIHGNQWHGKSLIQVIQKLHKVSYYKALQIAYYECLQKEYPTLEKREFKEQAAHKRIAPFKIVEERRNWSHFDKAYWNGSTGISSAQLESEAYVPLAKYWVTDKYGKYLQFKPKSPTFLNTINTRKKIYGPKDRLFLTNIRPSDIGGLKPFEHEYGAPRILFLTKNGKSTMTINNVGYNSRFLPNEGLFLANKYIQELNEEFDFIFFLMDNDPAGLKASFKLQEQWERVTGNIKGIACNFPVEYLDITYRDSFNQIKRVSDSFDVCKKWDLTRLDKELELIIKQYVEL